MTQPEIRFNGFSDEWVEKKLSDIGSTFTGLTGKTKDDFGHGEGRFVTYVNVFQNPIATIEQTGLVEIDDKQNQVRKGDIFFTTSSETPQDVGMASVWMHDLDNVYLNSFTFGYRLKEAMDSNYAAFMLRSAPIRRKISFLAQGISRYNVSKIKLLEISVPFPSLPEQQKIGALFSKYDAIIALREQKLAELNALKKGMLQQMFDDGVATSHKPQATSHKPQATSHK